ncbi:MAG: DUF4433 domain-containing protein [Elusimicrobiota bacterium]|nr:DUF4433 domain-containing protein [Elusimicrobiota bacterium]
MTVPIPTPIYRFTHVDNLKVYLQRKALHAPNHPPSDGLPYKTIHNIEIQNKRKTTKIPCGPDGCIHDYIAFYFGPRSPMLYQLHTGYVSGYTEGQEPLIYLVSTAQAIKKSGTDFVFSDGHGIAAFTEWFDNLTDLGKIDWADVYASTWKDTLEDPDRQRRKQAEFLVHKKCDWNLIQEIGVVNSRAKDKVEEILNGFSRSVRKPVTIKTEWYY